MHKYLFLPLAAALLAQSASAGKKKEEKAPVVAEKKAPVRPGLLGVSHEKDDWYVVVHDSLIGRPMLVTTRYVSTPAGAGIYGGELANRQVMTWERKGDKLLLRAQMHELRPIARRPFGEPSRPVPKIPSSPPSKLRTAAATVATTQ